MLLLSEIGFIVKHSFCTFFTIRTYKLWFLLSLLGVIFEFTENFAKDYHLNFCKSQKREITFSVFDTSILLLLEMSLSSSSELFQRNILKSLFFSRSK